VTGVTAPSNVAHFNYGVMRAPYDDPSMAEFARGLDAVHAVAERSEGFVWRFEGSEAEAAAAIGRPLPGHPLVICSFSVWRTVEDFDRFVNRTLHGRFLQRREDWFVSGPSQMVLWPVADGHSPDIAEALDRLDELRRDGPRADLFDMDWWRARAAAEPAS
jgi:Domain of unknown function (DUF3291).